MLGKTARTPESSADDDRSARYFESWHGEHWAETKKLRPLNNLTRGDIAWFVLGHVLLVPLALVVLFATALCLPLYICWMLIHRLCPGRTEVHGEVNRMMAEPRVDVAFVHGAADDANPDISVIMPFYNREEWVDWAVGSVLRQIIPPGTVVELIAVDNGSTDGTVEKLKRHPLRLIHCAERGPGAARNAGIAAARAPILVFTDSDCVADTCWLQFITEPFRTDPDLILAGGDILAMHVDGYMASFANEAGILSNRRFFCPGPYFPRFFATANLACRTDAARAIGGFDNSLWMSEDADFCWRLMDLGGKMAFLPHCVIYHQHRSGMGKLWRQSIDYGAASVSIFAKHRRALEADWAVSWKNIRDIAWSPFDVVIDQLTAKNAYGRKHAAIYCLWRLGFTLGSLRECWRKRVFFL